MVSTTENLRFQHWVLLAVSLVLSTLLLLLLRSSASAATINVVAGTDAIQENNQCQLSEAIQNINDQAQTNNDCPAGDGNNDTINLPTGTITLSADLPIIGRSINVQGQGKIQTVIDGMGLYTAINVSSQGGGVEAARLSNFGVRSYKQAAIVTQAVYTVDISKIRIDGTGSIPSSPEFGGSLVGIYVGAPIQNEYTLNIVDVYISDIAADPGVVPFVAGILLASGQNSAISGNISRTTVNNVSATGSDAIASGIALTNALNNNEPTNVDVAVKDSTLEKIVSEGSSAGVTVNNISTQGTSSYEVELVNSTIVQILFGEVQQNIYTPSSGIVAGTAAINPNDVASTTFNIKNVTTDGGCKFDDINQLIPSSQGTVNNTFTSLGGNISDDQSCNDYFNQSTDKNNITNLSDYFGDIADNGGPIPTLALLPGNPAIDGGVCGEGVPSADARGIARPQGKTCDSGAFEVEQAAPTSTVQGGKTVAVDVPTGVIVNQFGAVSSSIPADNRGNAEYEFPLGLLSFELGVPNGSTNEISLDFESSLNPDEVVARKYNPSDQSFTTLTNATITRITKDNKPMLRLTYAITDGTFPDLDAQANGTIVDPIGLAVEKKGVLANTGDLIILAIPIGISLLLGAFIVTYIDYRKHKKPLQEADSQLAQSYTYWHHLKIVTVPLFSYRIGIIFEKKEKPVATSS